MANFNTDLYNRYIDSKNYYGAISYLKSMDAPTDNNKKLQLKREIDKLTREAEIQDAYLSNATADERQAYFFSNALNDRGIIPYSQNYKDPITGTTEQISNRFGDRYRQLVYNLKEASTGDRIDKIHIRLTDEGYDNFLNYLNLKSLDGNDYDISETRSSNIHMLEIPTSSINLYKVLKAADNVDQRWSQAVAKGANEAATWAPLGALLAAGTSFLTSAAAGASTGLITGAPTGPGAIATTLIGAGVGGVGGFIKGLIDSWSSSELPISISGRIGDRYVGGDMFNQRLKDIIDVGDSAAKLAEGLKQENDEQISTDELAVTGQRGYTEMVLNDYVMSGKIGLDEYKKLKDILDEQYDRLLKGVDLTQQEVYASGYNKSDNNVLTKINDNKERQLLTVQLMAAIQDNRVEYQSALRGGEYGTYITIMPKTDKEQNLYTDNNPAQYKRIFIPNLFQEEAEALYSSEPSLIAARNVSDIKHFNYSKRLNNGEVVGHDSSGFYLKAKDENGELKRYMIDDEQAVHKFHRDTAISQAAESLLSNSISEKWSNAEILKRADMIANVLTNELYPEGSFSNESRLYEQKMLYQEILELLNLTAKKEQIQ